MRRDELIGAWKLESYIEEDVETGEIRHPMGENPQGLILYTGDGYMSAQLGTGGRPHFVDSDLYGGSAEEYAAAGATYIAYSGPFHFDEGSQLLEHAMFVSFFPNWQGQRQVRVAAVDGDRLHLATYRPMRLNGRQRLARLAWRRAEPNA